MNFSLTENLDLSEMTLQIILELLIVLGIGLVVGLEREYSKASSSKEDPQQSQGIFAGVRTFPIVALIGYLSIYLNDHVSQWIYPFALLSVAGFSVTSYYLSNIKRRGGSTTEFALIAVFLLSGLVYQEEYLLSAFLGLLITALLAFKVGMHQAVAKLSRTDILSILLFLAITALVLPLLPDKNFGPYGALNPFHIWSIVSIFISLNFVGYFLHKFIPSKYSILATGILGGFVSSTATAWYFSRLGGRSKNGGVTHVGAIVIASAIMFPRIMIWLFIFNATLLKQVWLPLLIFGFLTFGIGLYFSKKSLGQKKVEERSIDNPINLKDAGIFAGIFVLVLILVGFAEDQLGNNGIYYAAGISGLTNVDAITISMAKYAQTSSSSVVAVVAVLIAAFANTLVKYALCLIFGNNNMRKYASFAFVPLFISGVGYVVYLLVSKM